MFGPLETIIFISILGGLIAGLLVLVIRGIPLLIKYLINPNIKKDNTIKKKTRLLKILNKINFRSYGLKEWAFISIIVFVSFFFVEKFYKSIGHDLINNGYEVIEDSFESITKKYKSIKRDYDLNRAISSSSKKLGITKDEVKKLKRKESSLAYDFRSEYNELKNQTLFLSNIDSSKTLKYLSRPNCEKEEMEIKWKEATLSILVSKEAKQRRSENIERLEEKLKLCIQDKEKKEIEKKRNFKLKKIKLNCYQKRISKLPNIFTYTNLEKYKKDLENISKC